MSSSSALGGSRVGAVMTSLAEHGYRCARVSASGQRKGSRRDEAALAGDIIALATTFGLPHLLVEVGGAGKRLGVAFAELQQSILPGFAPLVVRFVKRRRLYYVSESDRAESLLDVIDALRPDAPPGAS